MHKDLHIWKITEVYEYGEDKRVSRGDALSPLSLSLTLEEWTMHVWVTRQV